MQKEEKEEKKASRNKDKEVLKNPYEVVVIMHPETTLEQQKELFKRNKSIINENKGTIFSLETWGKRTLANPISKNKKGIYFHSMFESEPAAIAELERTMRINDRVLRFLHTKLDPRLPLTKHHEVFKRGLQESANREKEKEAKIAAKKAAYAAMNDGERPERGERGERSERGERY